MNLYNSIRIKTPKRNKFNLSHDVKLSMEMGQLVPILCQDVIPGDTFKCNSEVFIRFAPMIAPIMHRINVYVHYFFVPKRLVWDAWKQFITGGVDGKSGMPDEMDETVPAYPRIKLTNGVDSVTNKSQMTTHFVPGTLSDYLGFPVQNSPAASDTVELDALPFRAYQLIYNEYYRDQTLDPVIDIGKYSQFDGVSSEAWYVQGLCTLRKRAWQKDYFTSALPWPQRGDAVELPLYGDGNVILDKSSMNSSTPHFATNSSENPQGNISQGTKSPGQANIQINNANDSAFYDPDGSLKVDMQNVSAATINELRQAIKAQEFLELSARGGSRYIEQILAFFGVKSSDARLQRPEYLGGGKQPVIISDVLQTSQSTKDSPQAQPAGNAVSLGKSNSFKRFFEEHGYVIGIMSVMPVPAYQQGMPRQFTKFDRLDHYWPQFAHLGEQEIKSQELYFKPNDPHNDDTFGYAPRYAEYKFINSSVHGDFRNSLNFWHLGRIFSERPNLNSTFIHFQDGTANRAFAVQDSNFNHLWVSVRNNITALRPMPKYGTPLL